MRKITPRQAGILEMLSQGLSQDEVAAAMNTSKQVICEDVKRARDRQGYGNTTALIRHFVEMGGTYTAADELPDDDEPQGPVQRCTLCGLVLPHECVPDIALDRAEWPVEAVESAFDDLADNRTRPTMPINGGLHLGQS